VLSVVPEYSDEYVPKLACKFTLPLNALKDAKYIEMEHRNLLEECKLVFVSVAITTK